MIRKACEYSFTDLAKAFNEGFEGYFIPFNETAASLTPRLVSEDVALTDSPVFIVDKTIVGFVLVAEREKTARIAAMGVSKSHRGKGLGKKLLAHAVDSLRRQGFLHVDLECIDQNASALSMYHKTGFTIRRKLVGYEGATLTPIDTPVTEIKMTDYARAISSVTGLPWQLTSRTTERLDGTFRAFRLHDAFASLRVLESGVTITGLFVPEKQRRQGQARRLLQALVKHFNPPVFNFTVLFPETLAPDFFSACGFHPRSLSQYEMRLPLT